MKEKFAFLSFLFGIISITASIIWLYYGGFYRFYLEPAFALISYLSFPLGLIFGIIGLKSGRKRLSKIGIILSLIGMLLTFSAALRM
jgi:fumarate reductase subunit C